MKTLSCVFAFLFVSMLAMAGDYTVVRTSDNLPGGAGATNQLKIFVSPPTSASGSEVIELFCWNTNSWSVCNTGTFYRVSGDGVFNEHAGGAYKFGT